MQILFSFGEWIGTGPLHIPALILGVLLTLAPAIVLVMEISGWTFSGRRIVRNNFRWDKTAVLIFLGTAIIYFAVSGVGLDFITILPRSPRLAPAKAPILAVVFGLPGMLGVILGVAVSRLLQADMGLISLIMGLAFPLAFVWVTWIPYKALPEPNFSGMKKIGKTVFQFYLWAVIVGSLVHLWVMPALGELIGTAGAQAWGRMVPMILINHDLPYVIVGPILLAILYPLAKARRLYWRDRYVPAPASL